MIKIMIEKYEVKKYCYYIGKYRGDACSICNLRYKTLKEIPAVFHDRLNYGYHFLTTVLAEKFKVQFNSLEENTKIHNLQIECQYKKNIEIKNHS